MKIFWAWQFDLPGKIARHFIREALEQAIDEINQDRNIDETGRRISKPGDVS
jgi:hypothetical protein